MPLASSASKRTPPAVLMASSIGRAARTVIGQVFSALASTCGWRATSMVSCSAL